ncbi:hypothetical protein RJ639_016226 [Escallonia herrerae]|uniref:Uncharacterized protein n=1 Tax=Escallonia herrerae TaxID=1293975 RepID=A0AA88VHV6_9ASTE|nr:hypothetical protein RJ639_016226 [Escallonia herrerae]
MVLKKRLDYGFNGYQVPVIPRAPRSLRRRGPYKKSVEDSQICAFELLAAVAGKLLQESKSSASSNAAEGKAQLDIHLDGIKKEQLEGKAVRSECLDQGSCIESEFVHDLAALGQNLKTTLKVPQAESDSAFEHASIVTGSDISKKVSYDLKLEISDSKNADGTVARKPEEGFPADCGSRGGDLENGTARQLESLGLPTRNLTLANTNSPKDPMKLSRNTHMLINSEGSVQLPLYRDPVPKTSLPRHRNDVNLGTRDDDENYFRCNLSSTKIRAFRSQTRIGYRRIRKMLTSRYWKVAPKLRDCEFSNTGRGVKSYYRNRKIMYKRERCQPKEAPSKRRKLYDCSLTLAYDQEASSESISNSPEKGLKGDKSQSAASLHRATGLTNSGIGHKAPFQSKDPQVKLSIKSFRVPELYIEVPETATVGSLKRTVVEAVTAILGGGLRVGVLLQGKKVRDDNRTLRQSGISQSGDLDDLGFMLEPSFAQASSPVSHKDPSLLLPCSGNQQLYRSPAGLVTGSGLSNSSLDAPPANNLDNHVEVNHEIVHSHTDVSTDGRVSDSKALVAIPAMNAEALAVVPMSQKAKRSELAQRRTRRPFSVSEVEALVEAVEKLGTGRWRDVKMRAFDDANHRTYVDLKDKWKTLVHTASIAPQQRRGEPVPQDLLDRVLCAHAYWSQHQSKQHGKHLSEPLKFSDSGGESWSLKGVNC